MKRALLILFLASVAIPCLSQQPTITREKKHSPVSSMFKKQTEHTLMQHAKKFDDEFPGNIIIRNNARADSILVSESAISAKGIEWAMFIKEIPTYYEGTTLIKELERWKKDPSGKAYLPYQKHVAGYDGQGRLTRLEFHLFENDTWAPQYAEEVAFDEIGGETFYGWYIYNENLGDWELEEGFRAIDEHNAQGALIERVWEYFYKYYTDNWMPDWKEEYILNDDGVIVEIIESFYDDWYKSWEYETRMTFELDQDNAWKSGYAYYWDWLAEEWNPQLKYVDMAWHSFEYMQIAELTTLVNPDSDDHWDDFSKRSEEDIEWLNYMRLFAEYTPDGLMTRMYNEFWYHEDMEPHWSPVMLQEWEYDHFNNVVYNAFSMYDIYDIEDWVLFYGHKLVMAYNDDYSIQSYDLFYMQDDYWKTENLPLSHSEYFYSDEDDTTDILPAEAASFSVYPNPASSVISFAWDDGHPVDVSIISLDGKVLARYQNQDTQFGQTVSLDVSSLRSGMYLIQVSSRQSTHTARFLKR